MRIEVNGTKLFFEVVGSKLRFSGPDTFEKPSLIVLHGGPGFDHTGMRSFFDRLSDIAQIIYLDHRGNGRSDRSTPEHWSLTQWADDIKHFADALEIEKPIVLGQSFGGFVAQAYAITYPTHAAGLILSSTSARMNLAECAKRIEKAGGKAARTVAERFWSIGGEQSAIDYVQTVLPLYVTPGQGEDAYAAQRTIRRVDVALHFFQGEIHTFDFSQSLRFIRCPVLIISGGDGDLVTPPEDAREIAESLSPGLAQLEIFPASRHGAYREEPDAYEVLVRKFIQKIGGA